jgi:hypothetical protein
MVWVSSTQLSWYNVQLQAGCLEFGRWQKQNFSLSSHPNWLWAYPPSCSAFTSAHCLYMVIKKWKYDAGHYLHSTQGLRMHAAWPAFILHKLSAWCLRIGQTSLQLLTYTWWWGMTSDCNQIFLWWNKVMSNIIGAQKRNLFKKLHLLPVANEYLVFLITMIHLSVLKNGNMANMSTFKTKLAQ